MEKLQATNEGTCGTSDLTVGLCEMVIIETPTFDCLWECSECKTLHKPTKKFYKSTTCSKCGSKINNWIGEDDSDDA